MTATYEDLAKALSAGLDLCVRARKLDTEEAASVMADMFGAKAAHHIYGETRCLTPLLWVKEQYDTDLAKWEAETRALLMQLGELPL